MSKPDQAHLHAKLLGAIFLAMIVVTVACQRTDESDKSSDAQAKAAKPEAPKVVKAAYEKRWESRPFEQMTSSCYNCHETLSRRWGRPARDHITSSHFRAAVACHECHGGDHMQDDMEAAHDEAKGFIGGIDPQEMTQRCGVCHTKEVATFTASKHFPDHEGVRKVTCVECHGSHDVGARPDTFLWTANCAQCHDLETVPDLPAELKLMTDSKDEVHAALRELRTKLNNQPFPAEIMEPYREVRQLSADVVHATQATDIKATMDTIIAKDKALIEKIKAATAQ